MSEGGRQSGLRKVVSLAFGAVSLIALGVFNEAISAFATKRGWDQFFINGWQVITNLGYGSAVAFVFFALGGATLALWIEFWIRDRHDAKARMDRVALSCTARFRFAKGAGGDLTVELDEHSENVAYFAWYVNNGGTMHNEAVLVFVEFEKEIRAPEVLVHSAAADGKWQQFASTDRFMFVQLKGWPEGEVVLQAVDSKTLGLDSRSELQVWRPYAPIA